MRSCCAVQRSRLDVGGIAATADSGENRIHQGSLRQSNKLLNRPAATIPWSFGRFLGIVTEQRYTVFTQRTAQAGERRVRLLVNAATALVFLTASARTGIIAPNFGLVSYDGLFVGLRFRSAGAGSCYLARIAGRLAQRQAARSSRSGGPGCSGAALKSHIGCIAVNGANALGLSLIHI